MMKQCPECGTVLRCEKCIVAGAFGLDAYHKKVHVGKCEYEACEYCVEEARKAFWEIKRQLSE